MRDLTNKQKILLDNLHKRLECRKVEHISNNDWEKLKENGEIEKCINHYTIILFNTYYKGFSSSAIRSHVETAKKMLEEKALPKDGK